MLVINMTKAREIANAARREARAKKFAPLDIEATIPGLAESAEAQRQTIREHDAQLQQLIAEATTPETLKTLVLTYQNQEKNDD
jgi:hypothetical protein